MENLLKNKIYKQVKREIKSRITTTTMDRDTGTHNIKRKNNLMSYAI